MSSPGEDPPVTDAEPPAVATMPLSVAVDVQDHLITACNDLQRLQVLLADAFQLLLASFHSASRELAQHRFQGSLAIECFTNMPLSTACEVGYNTLSVALQQIPADRPSPR